MSTETVVTAQDAKVQPLTQGQKLRQDAESAAEVRALSNHPDVIALRVEGVRQQVDTAIWIGIFLGLAFTMVNVQSFAAAGAAMWSLVWCAAWLLDPMVSLVLVAVLRAEQITARYQVDSGTWAHRTKWFAFLATYVMNTWQSWAGLHVAGIVLHSVPPVLVFCAAETAPVLRDRLTEAVLRAAGTAFTGQPDTTPAAAPLAATPEPADTAPAPVREPRAPRRKPAARKAAPAGRKLLADYVADARSMWAPGIEITPAWARTATGCSRGLSPKVAEALRAEVTADQHTTVFDTAPTAAPMPAESPMPEDERQAA
jgi:hypothetical protein